MFETLQQRAMKDRAEQEFNQKHFISPVQWVHNEADLDNWKFQYETDTLLNVQHELTCNSLVALCVVLV